MNLVVTKAVKPRKGRAEHPRPLVFQNSLKPPGRKRVNKTHKACVKSIFYVVIDKSVHERKSLHNSLCRWYNRDSKKYFGVGVLRMCYMWTITLVLLAFLYSFFKINLGSQTLPQFFCFKSHCSQDYSLGMRNHKSFYLILKTTVWAFRFRAYGQFFVQILDVTGPWMLRIFPQKAFPNPHFRFHSPKEANHRCGVGI